MDSKIFITGGAGYIGSMLSTKLVNLGYHVTVLDRLLYSKNSIAHLYSNKNFVFINGDVRDFKLVKKCLSGKNFVIPLAALVGAKLCEKKKKESIEVNQNSIEDLISLLKKDQNILYPTTNSGYGVGKSNKYCNENSELNPISLYGLTKVAAEKIVSSHKNFLSYRLATVFGYSYRMRTDLLVNNLTLNAYLNNKLKIFEGHFRRNFVHIKDVVDSFIFGIENFNKIKNNIYNIGLSSANITKYQLAIKIKKFIPKLKIQNIFNVKDPDQRDYFVSNKKIEQKGFKAKISIEDGINELLKFYKYSDFKIKNNY